MRLFPITVAFALFIGCDRTPDETGETDSDADTDSDSDSDTDTDTDSDTDADADCGVPDAGFTGTLEAAQITTDNYTHDANLAAVIAAFPSEEAAPVTVDIQVTGATVTLLGYTPADADIWAVWLADANGAIHLYVEETPITVPVKHGDKVTFRVTEIDNYAGEIEITKIADFAVDDSPTSSIWVQEVAAETVSYEAHGREVVHTYGRITSAPEECGGSSVCADWLLPTGQTVVFRVNAVKGIVDGDCIEVVAPVGTFDGDIQFNINDLDWMTFY